MSKIKLLGATALQSVIAVGALSLAQPALAQTASPDVDASAQTTVAPAAAVELDCVATPTAEGCQETSIVVTGSRIRRPNLESTVPITSIGGEQFFQQGQTNVGDTLNDLPQLRSTFAQQNPGLGIGIAGLNLLDLRGLGTQRTLVLVNGRRHVAGRHSEQRRFAGRQHDPERPHRARRHRDRRQLGRLRFGRHRGRRQLRPSSRLRRPPGARPGRRRRGRLRRQPICFRPCTARTSPTAAATSPCTANMPAPERVFASDVRCLPRNDNGLVVDADAGAGIVNGSDGFPIVISSRTSAARRSTSAAWCRSTSGTSDHLRSRLGLRQRDGRQ